MQEGKTNSHLEALRIQDKSDPWMYLCGGHNITQTQGADLQQQEEEGWQPKPKTEAKNANGQWRCLVYVLGNMNLSQDFSFLHHATSS